MSTYTQKLDTVKDLLNCGLSTTVIVKIMYQAWNVKEHKTIEFIHTVKAGYPEAGRAEGPTELIAEIAVTCAPELKANNHKHISAKYYPKVMFSDIMNHMRAQITGFEKTMKEKYGMDSYNLMWCLTKCECAPPINLTHLWVTRDTNENTNRA